MMKRMAKDIEAISQGKHTLQSNVENEHLMSLSGYTRITLDSLFVRSGPGGLHAPPMVAVASIAGHCQH